MQEFPRLSENNHSNLQIITNYHKNWKQIQNLQNITKWWKKDAIALFLCIITSRFLEHNDVKCKPLMMTTYMGDKEDSPKICDDDDDVNDQDDVVDGGVDVVWVKIFATTFKWSGSGRSVWATESQVFLFPTIDKNTNIIGERNTKIQIKKYNLQMEWSEPQSP